MGRPVGEYVRLCFAGLGLGLMTGELLLPTMGPGIGGSSGGLRCDRDDIDGDMGGNAGPASRNCARECKLFMRDPMVLRVLGLVD